jgi:hypothetical protein
MEDLERLKRASAVSSSPFYNSDNNRKPEIATKTEIQNKSTSTLFETATDATAKGAFQITRGAVQVPNMMSSKRISMLDILRNFDSNERKEHVLYSSKTAKPDNVISTSPVKSQAVIATQSRQEVDASPSSFQDKLAKFGKPVKKCDVVSSEAKEKGIESMDVIQTLKTNHSTTFQEKCSMFGPVVNKFKAPYLDVLVSPNPLPKTLISISNEGHQRLTITKSASVSHLKSVVIQDETKEKAHVSIRRRDSVSRLISKFQPEEGIVDPPPRPSFLSLQKSASTSYVPEVKVEENRKEAEVKIIENTFDEIPLEVSKEKIETTIRSVANIASCFESNDANHLSPRQDPVKSGGSNKIFDKNAFSVSITEKDSFKTPISITVRIEASY